MTTLTVDWVLIPENGELVAQCSSEPGWKYRTQESYSDQTKQKAETHLKSHRSRHTAFVHWAPAAPGALAGLGWPVEAKP